MTECNVKNRTIFCDDNLDILRGINSECIDLIYLDPPFNKNKKFTAPIGTSAEGASFRDIFTQDDLKEEWLKTLEENQTDLFRYLSGIRGIGKPYNFAYLAYMAIRLIECRRVLKPTGSIYLHCDSTMSHYLKTTMDCIFGEDNYRNEIVWKRTSRGFKGSQFAPRKFNSNTECILLYFKSKNSFFDMSPVLEPYGEKIKAFKLQDNHGRYYLDLACNRRSADPRPNLCYEYRGYNPPYTSGWKVGRKKMEELDKAGELVEKNQQLYRKIRPKAGSIRNNLWDDINESKGEESTGYPTQKPVALLKRIIKVSSNEDDIVLDPFCGCATTCVAAEELNRKWIGIDISVKAYELVNQRLTKEVADPSHLFKSQNTIHMRTDPPKRTDQGADYQEHKFVYVISHPNFPGEYKVGIAKDWISRLNSYQTSDPDRQYKLEFKFETPRFRETESHIHEKFENKHEWVSAKLKDIIDEIKNYNSI